MEANHGTRRSYHHDATCSAAGTAYSPCRTRPGHACHPAHRRGPALHAAWGTEALWLARRLGRGGSIGRVVLYDGPGRRAGVLRRASDRAWVAHAACGPHSRDRDAGGLLHGTHAAGGMAHPERRRAGAALCAHLCLSGWKRRRSVEYRPECAEGAVWLTETSGPARKRTGIDGRMYSQLWS